MAWRPQDHGSTSAIGLIVAAATFAIAFTAANAMVERPGGMDHISPQLDTTASTALDVIVAQSGRTATGANWLTNPDIIQRFGLADAGTENFLDYRKIKSMRNASMTHTTNLAPDYSDVRTALGIQEGDFHLRTYPVIPGYEDPRWTKDPRGRFAYVAHDLGTSTPSGSATVTKSITTVGTALNVSVTIKNEGATPYLFSATITLGKVSTNAGIVDEERHTRLLLPGDTQTLWVDFPLMAYTTTPTGVRVTVADAAGRVIDGPTWTGITYASSASAPTVGVKLSAGARYYTGTEKITFHADRFEKDGATPNADANWLFVLVAPDGSEVYNGTIFLKKKKTASYECATCTTNGIYKGYFYDGSLATSPQRAHDIVERVALSPSSGLPTFGGIAGKEIELIGRLVQNFDPTLYDATTNPEGDVFDDASKVRVLPPLLESRYTTLIIGSEVEQNALNSADIKWAIADWVIGGGNLMVLGRVDGHANWLQPVYKASIAGAGGGIGAPDPTHPLLTTPNRLDYQHYRDLGLAWGIDEDQPFTHVLTRGTSGGERQDALALANPGAYNDGSVVLTSYMPGSLTTPQDDAEAMRFLQNMLSQSYNMLFLDYGPPIPPDTPVGSAQRLVAVPHPNVPGAVVEVRIVMYAWS